MTTTDMQHEAIEALTSGDHAAESVPGIDERDEGSANDLLAKARYEAFRLVTDARTEAEDILAGARAEADAIRAEAQRTADSIIDAAQRQADETATASEPLDSHESVTQLEQEHRDLTQRVTSLRSLADQLEERFAALADTARPSPSDIDESAGPILDYSPSVPAPDTSGPGRDDESDEATEPLMPERGSFYSRRSAKLPRIGDAGGHNALDMMRSIRQSLEES